MYKCISEAPRSCTPVWMSDLLLSESPGGVTCATQFELLVFSKKLATMFSKVRAFGLASMGHDLGLQAANSVRHHANQQCCWHVTTISEWTVTPRQNLCWGGRTATVPLRHPFHSALAISFKSTYSSTNYSASVLSWSPISATRWQQTR